MTMFGASTTDRLPGADQATVSVEKIAGYLLSTTHSLGKEKAKFFGSFGFDASSPAVMREALLGHAATQPLTSTARSAHGVKYVVQCSIETPDRRNPCVRSVWIVEPGADRPRFITAYPN